MFYYLPSSSLSDVAWIGGWPNSRWCHVCLVCLLLLLRRKFGRLNLEARSGNAGAWCAKTPDAHQWLQINLGGGTTVTNVVTQGRQEFDEWVTSYAISYNPVTSSWVYIMTHGKKKVYGGIL